MKTFKQVQEGGGVIKTLAFFLRNKLSKKVTTGLSSTNTTEKLDAILSALGIVGSIGIMNIGMEDKGKGLLSRGVIIRGLINELYDEGIINQKEKVKKINIIRTTNNLFKTRLILNFCLFIIILDTRKLLKVCL